MHEALLFLFPNGVELLGHGQSCEGGDGKDLSLTAGEETGAVDSGDDADLGAEGTDLVHCTAVDTLAHEQPLLNDLLLKLVEDLVHELHHVGMLLGVLLLHGGDPLVDTGFTDVLVVGVHAVLHALELVLDKLVKQLLVEGGMLILKLGLADFLHHRVDEVEDGLKMLVRLNDALVHDLVGNLIRLGLDHDDLLVGCGDGGGHAVGLALLLGGVEEVLLTVPAENDAGDGSVKRNVGNRDGCGSADHCGNFGAAVTVDGKHLAGNDDVVAQVGGEQGTHGAVDEAGRQHCGQAGLALTTHEAAGDATDCVQLFVEVDGKGEVVDAVLGTCGSGAGDQNGGLTVGDQNCGVAKLRHLADLHLQGAAFVFDLELSVIGEFLVLDYHSYDSFLCIGNRSIALENTPMLGAFSNTKLSDSRMCRCSVLIS